MIFFNVKVAIKHSKYKSLKKEYKLTHKKLTTLLNRTKNQNEWEVFISYTTMRPKHIKAITSFLEIENKKYTIQEFNRYAQNTNILFR
jgi:hypothetical protein